MQSPERERRRATYFEEKKLAGIRE